MGNRSAVIGASVLAVLAIAAVVAVFVTYTPAVATVIVVGLCVLCVITLGALGLWASGRSRRLSMRIAVASSTITALVSIPPLLILPGISAGERVFHVFLILLTITAIVLVRGEIGRSKGEVPSTARMA